MTKKIYRIFSVIFLAIVVFSVIPTVFAESDFVFSDIFYESFSKNYGKFSSFKTGTQESVYTGVGYSEGTGGAVQLKNVMNYTSIHSTATIDANRSYKVSFWVRGDSNYSNKKAVLILKKEGNHKNSLGNNSTSAMDNYKYVGLDNGKPLTNGWQYVEDVICFNTPGITDEEGTTDIYFTAYMTNTGTTTTVSTTRTTYTVDEIKIEPLDIVPNGNMTDLSGFTFNSNANVYTTNEYGNDILVMTNKNGNAADMCRKIALREGETYKISYRAKTLSGTNNTQVLFSRYSNLYSIQPTPLYESIQEETVTSEWKTFSRTFTSAVKTTDTLAYRYPEMIFRVKKQGCVYVDDLKIEKVSREIKNIELSGECKAGETVNVKFTGNGATLYNWGLLEPDFYKVLTSGTTASETFSFTIPQNTKSIAVYVAPVVNGAEGDRVCTLIDDIKSSDFVVEERTEKQKIGTEWSDTVWTPDFKNVRAKVTTENLSEPLYGFLAVYEQPKKRLVSVDMKILNEGENFLSADAKSGSVAKLIVLDKNYSPKTKLKAIEKDANSTFIYAATDGGSAANGTIDNPANINRAFDILKSKTGISSADTYIMLKSGEYELSDSINLTAEHSGINGNVIVCSWGGKNGEKASLSGGRELSGWTCYDAAKNIYRARVTEADITSFRQLYINGNRAIRACTDIAPKVVSKTDTGYILNDTSLVGLENLSDTEFVYYKEWTNPRCGIDSITDNGDGTSTVVMSDFCWTQFSRKKYLEPEYPSYIENAYSFLDTPGEWYFNKADRYVYYMPRDFEDMSTVKAIIPKIETLVSMNGTYAEQVKNITFRNVEFAYSTWIYPDTYGYSDAQAGKLRDRLDENGQGNDPCPDAAVEVTHANNVNFEDCTFNKLGMSALSMLWGVNNSHITGNSFGDLSGTGIYIGTPYKDEVCTDWHNDICRNINIENNYFHDLGIDYKSCVPISTIHMYDTNISNNDFFNVPYSGIHGESGIYTDRKGHTYNYNYFNRMLNDVLYDGGSIYVTGESGAAAESWNEIKGNYIKNQMNAHAAMYTDNRSSGWMLSDNVIDFSLVESWPFSTIKWYISLAKEKVYLNNNYTTTDSKEIHTLYWSEETPQTELITNTHLYPDAQWPQEALNIIENAGLPEEYDARLTDKYQISIPASKKLTLKKGMSKRIDLYGEGGKNGILNAKQLITSVSFTPDVVSVSNSVITGKNVGDGQIKVYSFADGCMKSETINIHVY